MDRTLADRTPLTALAALAERARRERVPVGGLYGSARSLAIAAIAAKAPVVAIVPDLLEAEGVEDDLRNLARHVRTLLLRPSDPESLADPEGRTDLSERLQLLRKLDDLKADAVALVPAPVLLEALPSPREIEARSRRFAVGDRCDVREFQRLAHDAGFLTVPLVGAPAEISVRGDIVDLFPLGERRPVRIELFDDRIESIRAFDPETQRSVREVPAVVIPLVRPEELAGAAAARTFLQDHLPADAIVVRSEPARIVDRVEEHAFGFQVDKGILQSARAFLKEGPGIDLLTPRVEEPGGANVETFSVQGLGGGVEEIDRSLAQLRRRCRKVVLFAETDAELKRIGKVLRDRGLLDDDVQLRKGRVRSGFQIPGEDTAWLNHLELLGKPRIFRPRPRRPPIPAKAIENLLELSEGDHVVHLTHGVARFNGMMRMKRDEGEEDFLVLEFEGGTIFYLPASKIDLVQRYVGAGGAPPKLDRIGGTSWAKKKAKVRAALEELADELLEIQAAREVRDGPPHPKDEPLVAEFEASFPYADTPDQARTTREIHADLDGRRPMDRLLCGDVGFGKTEIAIRAAFRVICGGRQVAVMVPTTLLAEQHLKSFASRLANYPVQVAALSRFRTRKEQQQVVEGLAAGTIDVVIGTHRLLSKDVAFKDLGLVVVDEEHRFGVKAKEALKRLRRSVDVLSLSATPIPRTLHMALVGIRDISSLNTPPPGRRPVRTEIRRDTDDVIRRAIVFELNRGGQVFFVHNRVQTIERVAQRVARLVPTARVGIGHGQMGEGELEQVTQAFADGEIDVLVSTSIVESGLDLPRANTILIDRPELFGLADLHQLRGRVGRSDRQAYCHLLVPEGPLPGATERRLKAIEELSHLGAGYDIAIKDLEIRGAGNLLGAAQSGHIAAVGYDLFVQLLRRAVARAQGQRLPKEPAETDVDLGVEAFLPAEYVPDPGQRMELLRRLGAPDGPSIAELETEIRDRFGRIPKVARNLLQVFALKRRCRELGIRRLLHPLGADHVLVELDDPKRFHKQVRFEPREAAALSATLVHLHLPPVKGKAKPSPERALRFLHERLCGASPSAAPAG